jgi:hypothetical protein
MHGSLPPLPEYTFRAWCSVKVQRTLPFIVSVGKYVQIVVFWVVTPCIVLAGYQSFRDPCCIHLHPWTSETLVHGVTTQKTTTWIRGCIQKFPDWVDNEITINTPWEATQRVMAAKLTRLTHKIAIQLLLLAEGCTICTSRSRRPVRKLLDTNSYSRRSWSLKFRIG